MIEFPITKKFTDVRSLSQPYLESVLPTWGCIPLKQQSYGPDDYDDVKNDAILKVIDICRINLSPEFNNMKFVDTIFTIGGLYIQFNASMIVDLDSEDMFYCRMFDIIISSGGSTLRIMHERYPFDYIKMFYAVFCDNVDELDHIVTTIKMIG